MSRRLMLAVLALVLWFASLVFVAYASVQFSEKASQNHTALLALCAQRHDLDLRIEASTEILRAHHGPLIFSIPRTLIASGLRRDRATRHNLAILDCKE